MLIKTIDKHTYIFWEFDHLQILCVLNRSVNLCSWFWFQGDSGGPMSCSYDGKYYITGVVSWGSEDCQQKGYPSVFTRVTSYLNWINKHVSRG